MRIVNSITIDASPREVWNTLIDIDTVARCVPGVDSVVQLGPDLWNGQLSVRLGPISLSYTGELRVTDRRVDEHYIAFQANGDERRGRGSASVRVESSIQTVDSGQSEVTIKTDLQVDGAAAQYGEGLILEVSKRLTDEFAACISRQIGSRPTEQKSVPSPEDRPEAQMGLARILVTAIWRVIVDGFKKLGAKVNRS